MKIDWMVAVAAAVLAPTAALAQSEFNGTWKFDVTSAKLPAKPESILLQGGVYTCSTCVPAIEVKADGMAHAVTPSPYYDTMVLKVLDPMTIQGVRMKAGVVTGRMTETVAPGGGAMSMKYEDLTVPSSPVTGQVDYVRVSAGPAGAHAVSGMWRQNAVSGVSDNGLMATMAVNGSTVSYSTPSGQSYTAQLGGPPAPFVGDPGTDTVSIARGGPHTLVETDYRKGQAISVETMTVSPDGRSMTVVADDKLRGTSSTATLLKQ